MLRSASESGMYGHCISAINVHAECPWADGMHAWVPGFAHLFPCCNWIYTTLCVLHLWFTSYVCDRRRSLRKWRMLFQLRCMQQQPGFHWTGSHGRYVPTASIRYTCVCVYVTLAFIKCWTTISICWWHLYSHKKNIDFVFMEHYFSKIRIKMIKCDKNKTVQWNLSTPLGPNNCPD